MIPTDPLIGQQLANYHIEKLIGRGGMAKVYLGWDVRLHRSVAVKVIDDRFQGEQDYTERFLREARIMATWQHMNIPLVYNVGENEGLLYFAMEYIRGQTLSQLLRQRQSAGELLPEAEVLRIGWAIAKALDYAHQKGVIHRDVTPSNVSLSEDGRIVLMDFGLALDVIQGTRGEVFGTPHYIAPEQASNSAKAVMQTDLYSLGVMLYEMLTGSVPFDDPSPIALALKHITDEPPPPSKINPRINPEVEAVLLKALRKKPSERYQSGRELMEALEAALAREDSESQPATLPEVPSNPIADTAPTLDEIPEMRATQPQPEVPLLADGVTQEPEIPSLEGGVTREEGYKPSTGRSNFLVLGGLGCALLALMGFALLVGGISLALSRRDPPSQTSVIGSISQATPAPSRTPTSSQATPALSRTPTPASSTTSSPTPNAAATLMSIVTQPPSTPVTYELLFVGNKDDNLFVVNQGERKFPLAPLEFRNKVGVFSGEEWEVDFLESGECVSLWKKEGHPKAPKDIECDQVGQRLERSASDKFWSERFEIYYQGKKIGTCETKKMVCSIQATVNEH
ncbi:MAG: protein kinase [Anaerolineales bacterium]